ncbi:MAG: hypothetical protein B6245_22800, partial [Desulfobacteraceae bacterium 4572_88]
MTNMRYQTFIFSNYLRISVKIAGLGFFLLLISQYNFLFFHCMAELTSIGVAWGVFMIAWNIKQFTDNAYILVIGISYLFIGGTDLLHTLSYKGMNIFAGHDANLSTQLWIVARYMESFSLLIAPLLIRRKINPHFVFSCYLLVNVFLLASIAYWHVFPACHIEGTGMTLFKKLSEYAICLMLLFSLFLLHRKRSMFDPYVLKLIAASIFATILSELSFTFYVSVYGPSNIAGHCMKIISFYLLYKVIIEIGLRDPYRLLFKELKQKENSLQKSERRFRTFFEENPVGIAVSPGLQKEVMVNRALSEFLGYSKGELESADLP